MRYFGDDDELSLVFSFYVNQHLYLSLAREDPDPLRKALEAMPPIPDGCQWANFIKNHDEQNLDKLTPAERQRSSTPSRRRSRCRLYGRGIRRRLPTMLEGDERKLRLAYSLLFSLPGTPVLFYGEEIGMCENLRRQGPARRPHADAVEGVARRAASQPPPPKDLLRDPPRGDFGAGRHQRRRPAAMTLIRC